MSFQPVNITLWSNPTQQVNLPQWWGYESTSDDIATVSATGYFNVPSDLLISNSTFRLGDFIYCSCSDGSVDLVITALGNITTAANVSLLPALPSGDIFVGNASNVATAVAMSGDVHIANTGATTIQAAAVTGAKIAATTITASNIAANTITSAQLAQTTIQYATTAATAVSSLYATPLLLVAAPAAGSVIIPISFAFNYVFATAQYTSGGVLAAQYGATIHGAGQICSATWAAATLNAYTANELFGLAPAVTGLSSASIATGLYLSNQSNAFATGAGTIQAFVSYIVVPAS